MKARLYFREPKSDQNGNFVGWKYYSDIIELPKEMSIFNSDNYRDYKSLPEIMGVEYINDNS